ncbi:MAG: hypothetical protein BWX80_04106 [Candidatus Hydrogenedentes bacterium ADurb.Bin101]|nr:MAG: hypothetical protein BWX80_04106 [Candidatus Hydrogenedentes bacterium ADurb.Bin101]
MLVYGVTVEILVAHNTRYGFEFGQVGGKQAGSRRFAQGQARLQRTAGYRHKILADEIVFSEFLIDQGQVGGEPMRRCAA